jgi:hypothetical protein
MLRPLPNCHRSGVRLTIAATAALLASTMLGELRAADPPNAGRLPSIAKSAGSHAPQAGPLRRLLQRRARWCCSPPVAQGAAQAAAQPAAAQPAASREPQWQPLFDGKSLKGWKITSFGGEGEVEVENGDLVLQMGGPLTGVTYTGDVPKTNYEISVEAMRDEGIDFFCGLTFPVADSHCSFIVGGWAGAVVGLSSINGFDASENETTQFKKFESDRWYRFRVRVTPDRIQCWIDDEKEIDVDIRDKKIGLRAEVEPNKPLGFSSYETKARIRNVRIRRLPEK